MSVLARQRREAPRYFQLGVAGRKLAENYTRAFVYARQFSRFRIRSVTNSEAPELRKMWVFVGVSERRPVGEYKSGHLLHVGIAHTNAHVHKCARAHTITPVSAGRPVPVLLSGHHYRHDVPEVVATNVRPTRDRSRISFDGTGRRLLFCFAPSCARVNANAPTGPAE